MKRLSILIAVLFLLAIAGSIWFFYQLEEQEEAELYDALPPSTTFFMEIESWSDFNKKFTATNYYQELSTTGAVSQLLRQTEIMDQILARPDSGASLFDNRKLLIQAALTNAGEFDYLYLLETKNLNKASFISFIKKLGSQRKIEERHYKGISIFEASTNLGMLTIAYHKGILMACFTPFMVEEAIEQLNKSSWLKSDADFQSLNALSSSGTGIRVYIKASDEALLSELLIDQERNDLKQFVRNFASWIQLELSMEQSVLAINGYTAAGDTNFLSKFAALQPGEMEAGRILPVNTAVFLNIHAPLLSESESEEFPYHSYFATWVGHSRGFAILETLDDQWERTLLYYIQCTDSERARESLKEVTELQNQTFSQDYNGYSIGRLSGNNYAELLSVPNAGLRDPYYTLIGDFVLLANSLEELKKIISKYLNGNTLSRDRNYLAFNKQISSNSNFTLHIQPGYSFQLLKSLLNANLSKALTDNEKDWKNFEFGALQFSNFKGLFFTNGILQYNQKQDVQVGSAKEKLWTQELDAELSKGPFILTNHTNGALEILVQDKNNQIYLINRNGKLLWKKELQGQIFGDEVFQLDYYKNGKLQMVFNSESHIYLIDREGNNVAGFPLKLPVNSSNGLLLTNYDNKHIYRYFMAGRNRIYGFYQSGKPLPGWSPKVRAGTITQPLEYCQIKGIDYIIAANEEGELFYFDRRGEKKVPPILTKTEFDFPFAFIENPEAFKLYNFSKEKQQLFVVDMEGAFKTLDFNDTLSFFDFNAFDLDGDGNTEIVFTDTNTIYVYNSTLQLLETISSPIAIDSRPFQLDNKLGFLSKASGQIFLLDEQYSTTELFPLKGHSKFIIEDLFKNGNQILISSEEKNSLSAFKISLN
ncbi:MAG: DUF3352 domain-containing protein [Chitinophagales bacterium]